MQHGLKDIIESALIVFKDGAYLWKYQNCSDLFAVLECADCGKRKAIFTGCGLRICPECSKRRAKKLYKKYLRIFKALSSLGVLSLLTLTVRNSPTIEEGLIKLMEGWRKLKRRKYFLKRVKGGILVVEVKLGKDGRWNLHAHLLIIHRYFGVPNPDEIKSLVIPERLKKTKGIKSNSDLLKPHKGLGQVILSILWENITGDYVVDIRKVRSIKKGLGYVVKYLLKPPKFESPEHYVEWLEAFWKQPLLIPFGCVRNYGDGEESYHPICLLCGSSNFTFVCICLRVDLDYWLKPEGVDYG